MPREDRRIIFDRSETYKALYNLSLKSEGASQRLIAGMIVHISEDEKDDTKLIFHIDNPREGDKQDIVFSRDFVAAALMMFCRGAGIPLPRKAKKSVMIRDEDVILRVMV